MILRSFIQFLSYVCLFFGVVSLSMSYVSLYAAIVLGVVVCFIAEPVIHALGSSIR